MSKPQDTALRLMIVDDSREAAEGIVSTLRNAGIAVRPLRPSSEDELAAMVASQPVDVVAAQHDSSTLPLATVLQRVAETGKDVPVLAVADAIDQDSYLRAMASGARALALRSSPQLLLAAVRDAWGDLEARRAQRRLEARLRETERRCDALIDSSRDPIAYVHEGMHIRANAAYLEMFGYEEFEDIEGMSLLDMVAPQHVEEFRQLLKSLAHGDAPPPRHELQARDIDGNVFPAAMEFIQAQYEGEPCVQVVIRRQELDPELALEIEELRQRDHATGLYNRATFLHALEGAVDATAQGGARHGLLLVEPDHYQHLLADIGLDSADELLAAAAARVTEATDGLDAVAARFGEHTFAVLLRNTDHAGTGAAAGKVLAAFSAALFEIGSRSSAITASVGAVQVGERIASVSQILAKASETLASASATGGNRFELFDPSAADRAEEEHIQAWVTRLRDALDNEGFVLHYQPVIALQDGAGATYEAFLRLTAADGELIKPLTFLQIAEEHGLLWEIDRYVVGRAIAVIGERIRAGKPTTLLVKISQASLADDSLPRFIGDQLQAHGVPGAHLVLELAEAKVFTHLKATQAFAAAVAGMGCRLALENFGAGLDSFQLLAHLKPDMLKIDHSFTSELAGNADNEERVREITAKAHEMDIQTMADFVSDAASMSVLFSAGVDYVSGNFLAPSGPDLDYDFD